MRKWIPLVALALAGCLGAGEDAGLRRGDEALARGDLEEAVAEYRLALRQRPDEPEILLRVARASAELREVDDVIAFYGDLVARYPRYETQAITELFAVAHDAEARRDYREMALAVEAALAIEPSLGVGDLAEPLGVFYYGERRWERALVFLSRAMRSADPTANPGLIYDLGRTYRNVGDCERAIPLFDDYRRRVIPRLRQTRSDVEFYLGECSLELARTFRAEEDYERALSELRRSLSLREPLARLGDAYFLEGEILAAMGRCEDARRSFEMVREAIPSGTGALVQRANQMIDAIRFPSGRRGGRRPEGACF